MYLPREIASVSPEVAQQLCVENDNPAATLYIPKVMDAPPLNKMARAEHKKGSHG